VLDRGYWNFSELRKAEVELPRIPIPRTSVHKSREGDLAASVIPYRHEHPLEGRKLVYDPEEAFGSSCALQSAKRARFL
jgi:hypothetical protein